MKKMMMLAVMAALAALMLAAAPASAQTGPFRPIDGALIKPGSCGGFPGEIVFRQDVIDAFGEEDLEAVLPGNNPFFCVIFDDELPPPEDGDGDGDRDRDRDRDGFFDFDEPFISQDIEQEAESGDITQNFDVSQTGDNSNQTVGIQGTANTGNAQNLTNVVDAGPFVGDFDNNDGNDGFFNDGFVICDFDNDGVRDGDNDECEDFNNNDGFLVCDSDGDGINDSRFDDCVVIFPDFNDGGFFDDGDRDQFFVNGNNDGDIEIEDSGASITMSPTNTTNSHQEVNQAAAASATWPWWSM
jgi:hypothetical protein